MKKAFGFLVALLLVQVSAFADGYWLELKGSQKVGDTLTIHIRYGGVDEQKNRYIKNGHDLDKMKGFVLSVLDESGKVNKIAIQQHAEYWEGFFVPKKNGSYRVLAENTSLPVVERTDTLQNIKPLQYLCSSYQVGQKVEVPSTSKQALELLVETKGNAALIQPFVDGVAVKKGTKLRVFYPDNHDEAIIVGDHNKVQLPLEEKGLYLIRLDNALEQKGTFLDQKYYSVRRRCDYTLNVQ